MSTSERRNPTTALRGVLRLLGALGRHGGSENGKQRSDHGNDEAREL